MSRWNPQPFATGALALVLTARAMAGGVQPVNAFNKFVVTRAQAFGGAATALGNDPTLVWVNPAASAGLSDTSVTLGGQRGYFGDVTGQLLYSFPFRNGVLSAGGLYYDAGVVDGYTRDAVAFSYRLQQDFAAAVGYSRALAPRLTGGATLKWVHSEFVQQFTRDAMAVDAGMQLRMGETVKLGLAAANLGAPFRSGRNGIELPLIVRAGAAAGWRTGGGRSARADTVILVVDTEYRVAERAFDWQGGAEYQWRGMVAFRAGVRLGTQRELSAFSGGIGFRIGSVRLEYTIRMSREGELPQIVSLTFALPGRKRPPAVADAPAEIAPPPIPAPPE